MKNALISLFALTALNASAEINVIYGEDNRVDVYDSPNAEFVELSKSTAAMIPNNKIRKSWSDEVEILGRPLTAVGICNSERFAQQKTAADCSGFLVKKNIIITAGHCIQNAQTCSSYKWVFNYKLDNDSQSDISVSTDDVYSCKRVVKKVLESWSKDDYAVIELDRDVVGREPLKIRESGRPEIGDEVVVIGHPSGLPTKIADGANVRSLQGKYFVSNLDTYGGNSGSAVFNVSSGLVEGILVRGDKDYVRGPQGCGISNRVSNEGGRGEDVTYITNISL